MRDRAAAAGDTPPPTVTWGGLRSRRPQLAEAGQDLLYQFGVGLAFLATIRIDGGPRVHPMCPVIVDDGLYAFLIPSPKRSDLIRDGRFSMHSFPTEDNEDAFSVTGVAREVRVGDVRTHLVARFLEERPALGLAPPDLDDQLLFEFHVATCLLTRTNGHGDKNPRHTVWHASA